MSTPQAGSTPRTRDDLLADAVAVLTEAARLTRPVLVRDEAASEGAAYPVWVAGTDREPADWAEFVTLALAGVAANIGSVEAVLAGRPGSWEANGVRNLLTSTVGHDEEASLLEHRTEPVVVELYVDEILVDLGAWKPYDDAQREIATRYAALDSNTATTADDDAAIAAAAEHERQADELADLEERLEQQRERDWAAYGAALKAAVEAAASRLEGLRVPVVVTVDLQTFRRAEDRPGDSWGPAERVLDLAIRATPLPGDGRTPLDRL